MLAAGPYVGIVESNSDPEKLGRIKVSVAHVYGIADGQLGSIGVNDLPWAMPAGLPSGGSPDSGGLDWLPEPGDQVLIFLLDGEPEKPVWLWMMQTIDQAKNFALHNYDSTSKKPTRSALTRYGHTIEFNSGSITLSTKSGYQTTLINGTPGQNDGLIQITTPKGQQFEFDDQTNGLTTNVNEDCQQVVGRAWTSMSDSIDFETVTGNVRLTAGDSLRALTNNDIELQSGEDSTWDVGNDLTVTAEGDIVANGTNITINSDADTTMTFAKLSLGQAATEPFVLGTQLLQFLNVLLLWLAGHAHSNGNNGSPTGPPIIPPQPEVADLLAKILSETITGH